MPEAEFNPLDGLLADTSSSEAEAVQPDGAESTSDQGQPSAPDTSAVQPEEGQGQQDAQTGLYDLSTVPEEYRSHVEQHLKDIERNANAKFQEHAEYRKSWEPYSTLGITDVPPDSLGALLEFAQQLADPESARDAVLNLAQALELDLASDPDLDEGDEPDPVSELRERLDRFEQEKEQAAAEATARAEIAQLQQQALTSYQAEYAEVEKLNGTPFSKEEKEQLIGLAKRFQNDNDEPIKAAFTFINSISGRAEAALVNGQPAPPAPAEPSGRASSVVQPVESFEDALRLHLERNASAS
jgi:hypothetical protein